MNTSIKWAAELEQVQEVSLLGTADRQFWQERLATEKLQLVTVDGRAQLMLIATDMTYKGIRFQELSIAVIVYRPGEETVQDAAYLLQAFNSCRLFAFSERILFKTPYAHGDVRVAASFPPSLYLLHRGRPLFRAAMATAGSVSKREPSLRGEAGWEGPIFLPSKRSGERGEHVFYGRLRGPTEKYSYHPELDSLTLAPTPNTPILQMLVASRFVPTDWILRPNAQHAKSKTYRRRDMFKSLGE